ncbi:hypothetical protein E0E54_15820 [Azotobacter chroococcum]|uniref:hypothetical protein n=1 Tax=Azotobacter chroococcum TaxID=353 RepID=UPI00103EA992|nr:hypothetical protein [Azotobacter chroococcum]TBW33822.1 hypothetical protein E0E54_15820 [Azotobacter chroococcum]
MKEILKKCEFADFEYLSSVLDSYVSLTDDSGRQELLNKSHIFPEARPELIALIDKQIRYYGSSDVGYAFRSMFSSSSDGGISSLELIEDVCEKLKVTLKKGGAVESRLERLVTAVVERELLSKNPSELVEAFKKIGVGEADANLIKEHLVKNGKVAILPIIVEVLGPKVALGIIETIIISLITQIIGREAAKVLVKEVMKRNPWLNALGPIMWALSGAWLAFDLQGPAFRKTVPICLYLGIVALRDGVEDDKATP